MRVFYKAMIVAAFSFAAVSANRAIGDVVYAVHVDTSSVAGQTGDIDLEFNGSGSVPPAQLATATVGNFQTDAMLNYDPEPTNDQGTFGNATGGLPGGLSFDNSTTSNAYTSGITFGTYITFDLTFGGPAFTSPDGSGNGVFQIDFLNAAEDGYLLTNDPTGSGYQDFNAAVVQVNGDGTTTFTPFPNLGGGPSAVTFAVVPLPSTLCMGALGLLGMFLRRSAGAC